MLPLGSSLQDEVRLMILVLRERLAARDQLAKRASVATETERAGHWDAACAMFESLSEDAGATDQERAEWSAALSRCKEEVELAGLFDSAEYLLQEGQTAAGRELLEALLRRRRGYFRNGIGADVLLASGHLKAPRRVPRLVLGLVCLGVGAFLVAVFVVAIHRRPVSIDQRDSAPSVISSGDPIVAASTPTIVGSESMGRVSIDQQATVDSEASASASADPVRALQATPVAPPASLLSSAEPSLGALLFALEPSSTRPNVSAVSRASGSSVHFLDSAVELTGPPKLNAGLVVPLNLDNLLAEIRFVPINLVNGFGFHFRVNRTSQYSVFTTTATGVSYLFRYSYATGSEKQEVLGRGVMPAVRPTQDRESVLRICVAGSSVRVTLNGSDTFRSERATEAVIGGVEFYVSGSNTESASIRLNALRIYMPGPTCS